MMDICQGNLRPTMQEQIARMTELPAIKGNFQMCDQPTNPIEYLGQIHVGEIWRFILSHPDMDHLDGFDALCTAIPVHNFWDSGVRKPKPDFSGAGTRYNEADWDRYVSVRDGLGGTNVMRKLAGDTFPYANLADGGKEGGDGVNILAPDGTLVSLANAGGDPNDASYVILYRSGGGKILLPGDAHDETWRFVLRKYSTSVSDCSILVAPHHGRKSGRDYGFLDTVRPKLSLFGCAPAEYLAYDAWNYRKLPKITNNQAGNIVLEIGDGVIDVFVQNSVFAQKCGGRLDIQNSQKYFWIGRVD